MDERMRKVGTWELPEKLTSTDSTSAAKMLRTRFHTHVEDEAPRYSG